MPYNTIKLIWGYLPTVDDRSFAAAFLPNAAKAGLTQRVAVVFNTYRPDKSPDMHFNWTLLLALLRQILLLVEWDSISIAQDETRLQSLDELQRSYENWIGPDQNPDPPQLIKVTAKDKPVCFIVIEDYTGIGGPIPYHDSLTFSFYFQNQAAATFRDRCLVACAQQGTTISEEIMGVPVLKISAWRKLLNSCLKRGTDG